MPSERCQAYICAGDLVFNAYGGYGKLPRKWKANGRLFAAILYTANAKMTRKRHGVTQKADGINTIPVKHQNAPAE